MTPNEAQMWEVLNTSPEELRRRFVEEEFRRMIETKIATMVTKDVDRAIYSSMVKSYYEVKDLK